VERERLGEPVGCQDQMLAAFGGLNYLEFRALDDIRVTPLPMHPERREALRNRLMMFYTHIRRDTRDVVADQNHRTKANGATLEALRRLAERGRDVLAGDDDLRSFGELLHEGWRQKKRLSSRIAHNAINDLYDRAIAAGAVGGKLLGAGRGGFLLFYVEPEQQATVRQAMAGYPEVTFGFGEQGARVILYQDN
jgi:D-glycero-alpha-D-manno-heptose-7-phosphate kinase